MHEIGFAHALATQSSLILDMLQNIMVYLEGKLT